MKAILFGSPWPYRLLRLLLAGVFIWAGAVKLVEPRAFARLVSAYGLVPENLLVPFAIGLPLIEVLAGMGLLMDVRGSVETVFGLLLLFVGVLTLGILKDLDVDCGCFSVEDLDKQSRLRMALWRDLALMTVALYLFFWRWVRRQPGACPGSSRLDARLCKEEYR